MASALAQTMHAVAVSAQGVTADAKLSVELTGHTTGGGCGGGLGGGRGGDGDGQALMAAKDCAGTPSATM